MGTVEAPALSDRPLSVTGGTFNLFTRDAQRVETRTMRYRMPLTAADGRVYRFDGFKTIREDPEVDLWTATTTLFFTVRDESAPPGTIVGRGILRIRPDDFLAQLTTLRVLDAEDRAQRLELLARFGRFFAGALFDVFGGVARRLR